jgi:hypothetical protein
MKNAEELKSSMRPGRIYRRQDLKGLSRAVDRDLKTLLESGEVEKLSWGLYRRAAKPILGAEAPDDRDIVRTFLKTDDFLLTSFNHFTALGLGLTQLYNHVIVYNHRRAGEFRLGGKLFQFRVIRDYPKALSKEYLLVDLLNHIGKLPDDAALVLENLSSRIDEFDRDKLLRCLDRYGHCEAKRILGGMLTERRGQAAVSPASGGAPLVRENMPLYRVKAGDDRSDLGFWLGRPPQERVAAVEFLREQYYALSGYKSLPRLPHSIRLRARRA